MNHDIENALKKVPQYTRLKRHLYTLFHHSTCRRLLNLMAIEFQRKIKRRRVYGHPYFIIFDTGNLCNLKCPLCPTGLREKGVERKIVKFEDFQKIIDRMAPYAYEVSLHNWGEPFLNPDILKMIRYCTDKNIGTNLSSNLNRMPFDAGELIDAGLEYLVVSLDGTTQDIYSKYRVGGSLDEVTKNLKAIIEKKNQMKSKTPFIEWQFLVMKHNYHQIDEASRLAEETGVDLVRYIPVGLPFDIKNKKQLAEQWYPYMSSGDEGYIEDRFLQKPIEGGCFYLYRSVTINPVGKVAPCCAVWKEKDNFGDMIEQDFAGIWNNEHYQSARGLFAGEKNGMKTHCNTCPMFKK